MKGIKLGNKESKYPIIQGGMGVGVSLHKLAGTVSKEGGIGIISTADIGYKEEDFEKIAERRYRVEGSADLEEMLELFGMEEDPELDVSTVNGWVLGVLGRIPKEGEVFQYDKLTAKVTKADERRVIEVEVNAD